MVVSNVDEGTVVVGNPAWVVGKREMPSVLILTYNEAVNIADCIASIPWREQIYVLDSESTDGTAKIAEEMGAVVVTRPFTDYADQRNFGLTLAGLDEWIVMLDADERMTRELAAEIEHHIETADASVAMFRVRRKDLFLDRWLRRSSGYPTWFPRVFRRGRVLVERKVNESYRADGSAKELEGHILHFPFNKGLDWWLERHNRYSTMEARLIRGTPITLRTVRCLVSRDPGARREAQKNLAYRIPGRPFLVFIYLYIVRLGILDGAAGYQFACLRLAYEIMIDAKAAHSSYYDASPKT
ncbi:MAG: glycosyltransferase family 2 protein [Mesorhizobium sp.]|nr:MAG: glycosyltransferase family 2 protein [Mesorhizobium sp.]RWQ45207.1 MAG: glycosyltransferase family 2 protein [Mesorhizobium sp.]